MRLREEKMEEQRVAQEERLKRALERAQADPKKRVSRRKMQRLAKIINIESRAIAILLKSHCYVCLHCTGWS